MRRRGRRALIAAALLAACAAPATNPPDTLSETLGAALDTVMESPATPPGAMLRVAAPSLETAWADVRGVADAETGAPLTPEHAIRIASMTKSFVAASVLVLVQEDRLGLDDPVADHLTPSSVAVLEAGGYAPRAMTVRMLLAHTSGLYDYAGEDYFAAVAAAPGHRWTRAEQLAFAIAHGAPVGAPGERYVYADTGYILLGEILETTTGEPMPVAVRALVGFDRLGLASTWFETLEPAPEPAPVRARQEAGPLDTVAVDASADLYGGGGLVSTLADLDAFYTALVDGAVVTDPALHAAMLAPSPQSLADGGTGYGMGLAHLDVDGLDCYGHGGFWGSVAWRCPATDITVTAAVTRREAGEALRALTLEAIAAAARSE